jgi:hypothetical protein
MHAMLDVIKMDFTETEVRMRSEIICLRMGISNWQF